MVFQPGVSGNPKGKAPGTRAKPIKLSLRAIANRGDVHSIAFISAVLSSEKLDVSLRLTAASILASYQHAKCTARKISTPIDLPAPTTVAEAEANIARLAALGAAGTIGLDEMADLVSAQRAFAEVRSDTETERRLAAIEQLLREHPQLTAIDLTVVDGLPVMPGHENLVLPSLPRRLRSSGNDGSNDGAATVKRAGQRSRLVAIERALAPGTQVIKIEGGLPQSESAVAPEPVQLDSCSICRRLALAAARGRVLLDPSDSRVPCQS